jgi:hypothetical protein
MFSDDKLRAGQMELGGCLGKLLQNRYSEIIPRRAVMREYGRTPLPIGGLAPLGRLPRKEGYGPQKFGATQKEHSTARKKYSRGGASTQA